jgi:hypothetical protein
MGNGRVIRTGEVQYMSAGSGVRHSEFNPSQSEAAHFLQIWILPDAKNVKPRYAEKSLSSAPTGKFHLVASKSGRDNSIAIHQDAELLLARLESGQKVAHALADDRHAWLHVAEGEIVLNGKTLSGGDAAAISREAHLELTATKPSQVLLFDLN